MKLRTLGIGALLWLSGTLGALPETMKWGQHYIDQGRVAAHWLLKLDYNDPEAVFAALREKRAEAVNYSMLSHGMGLCRDIAMYGRATGDEAALAAAARVADALLREYATPSGAIIEWDRNTWLDETGLWRTIPWGVAFRGGEILEAWQELKQAFSESERDFWRASLERTGAWIYKNPVVGGYVFNNGIELCALLWRLGEEFDRPDWRDWALETAVARVERDIDEEGWIQAESGGSSGYYQLHGADFLAEFAWDSRSPELVEAVKRVFRGSALPYSTRTMDWPGNYGTRVSRLMKLRGPLVLAAAAFGDAQAAYFAREYGAPDWSDDADLWKAALATPAEPPRYEPVSRFQGIEATVGREGPWVAYFSNYDRSVWSRGFISLWHAGHQDWVFASLHALAPLDASLNAKSRLGDTSDWAGFPHVRIVGEGSRYDSHQRIEAIDAASGSDGLTVTWTEPLLSPEGRAGGRMEASFRFEGSRIHMDIGLSEARGEAIIDFHFMRRPNGFARLWIGEEAADIMAGRLLHSAGNYQTTMLPPGEPALYGVQVDRSVFIFEPVEVPEQAQLSLVEETVSGLHTGNLGGFRFRVALPDALERSRLQLTLRSVASE